MELRRAARADLEAEDGLSKACGGEHSADLRALGTLELGKGGWPGPGGWAHEGELAPVCSLRSLFTVRLVGKNTSPNIKWENDHRFMEIHRPGAEQGLWKQLPTDREGRGSPVACGLLHTWHPVDFPGKCSGGKWTADGQSSARRPGIPTPALRT